MNKHNLFNSFLLAISLAVLAWVARKAADSGERIAAMQSALDAVKENSARIEHKLETFDTRVLLVEMELVKAKQR